MKASLQEFFQLPAEKKRRFTQQEGRLEGYGQLFVVSEDQKLDWADMLFLYAQPPEIRKTKLWPDQPAAFSQADKVVGLSPHSDADLLTLVLQVNHVQGLQIKRNGSWFPVKPVEGTGASSTAWWWTPRRSGCRWRRSTLQTPLKELMARADGEAEAYATVEHERLRELFLATKLEGKSFLERMKLPSSS
ncbi:hypothetical protein CFC21_103856 [Triticum aestivum]|uniref:Isopenicillin N synthase-like Fe(2+) 2OG dioxygenase domain-containing protein n=2 Tax=Triticum aestivum TaxID=4565 RepID=A0A3B6KUI8_WHEAT|nr:hypothetical protein CFC21_103856 [Triticum aestivum]